MKLFLKNELFEVSCCGQVEAKRENLVTVEAV